VNYHFLSFIYWPVSFVLWCWHHVFGFIFGYGSAVGWALAIVFLVWTLRSIVLKPSIHSVRSMRKMQELQPQLKEIQKKYANDKQRQGQELQKFQRENGVNPLGGCLPMLLQIPVFIGLFEVVLNFSSGSYTNYFIPHAGVVSYNHANLFGDALLGDPLYGVSFFTHGANLPIGPHPSVAVVAVPLMVIASVSTHFTARISARRQASMPAQPGQPNMQGMMRKLSMWVFPLGVLVIGTAYPLGLLLYWLGNNTWTLGQQYYVFKKMDREENQKKEQQAEAQKALAPKPGQKPVREPDQRPAPGTSLAKQGAEDGAAEASGTRPKQPARAGRSEQSRYGRTGKQTAARQGAQGKQAAQAKQRERAQARVSGQAGGDGHGAQGGQGKQAAQRTGGSAGGKSAGGGASGKPAGSGAGGKPRDQAGAKGSGNPGPGKGTGKAGANRNGGNQGRARQKAGKGSGGGKQGRSS
jgi:YidC/Oxa1 family membrane protein insertase